MLHRWLLKNYILINIYTKFVFLICNIWLCISINFYNFSFSDTDSLLVHVQTDDLYKDLEELEEHLDFSDFKRSSIKENYPSHLRKVDANGDVPNRKKPGKFKVRYWEINAKIILVLNER